MLKLNVNSNLATIRKQLDKMAQGNVQFGVSKAMNLAATQARSALKAALISAFDKPTPYTLNSLFQKNSTKKDLNVQIGHKGIDQKAPEKRLSGNYLEAEIEGGSRELKPTERVGGLNMNIVPTKNARLDSYGNIPARILSIVRQAIKMGQVTDSSGKDYVCIKPGNSRGLVPGVYVRVTTKTKTRNSGLAGGKVALKQAGKLFPIVFFEEHVHYKKRYDPVTTVWSAFTPAFEKLLPQCLDDALSSTKVGITGT